MTDKRYLTAEEIAKFTERYNNKCFDFTKLSLKIFKKGTEDYRKGKLHKVLKGEVRVTPAELNALEMYAECWMLSDTTFQQMNAELEKLAKIESIICGSMFDDPFLGVSEGAECEHEGECQPEDARE